MIKMINGDANAELFVNMVRYAQQVSGSRDQSENDFGDSSSDILSYLRSLGTIKRAVV